MYEGVRTIGRWKIKKKSTEKNAARTIGPIRTDDGRTQPDIFDGICVSRDFWELFLGTRTAVRNPYSLTLLYTFLFFFITPYASRNIVPPAVIWKTYVPNVREAIVHNLRFVPSLFHSSTGSETPHIALYFFLTACRTLRVCNRIRKQNCFWHLSSFTPLFCSLAT